MEQATCRISIIAKEIETRVFAYTAPVGGVAKGVEQLTAVFHQFPHACVVARGQNHMVKLARLTIGKEQAVLLKLLNSGHNLNAPRFNMRHRAQIYDRRLAKGAQLGGGG